MGRPNKALNDVAERVYQSLSDQGKSAAERMFKTLARPGVGAIPATSQTVSRKDLLAADSEASSEALKAFEDAGLLRVSLRADAPRDGVTIISDRLMFRWHRLDTWLGGERQKNQRRLQLLAIAKLWQDSGHQEGYLLSHQTLINEATEEYVDSTAETILLREFIFASKEVNTTAKFKRIIGLAASSALSIIGVFLALLLYGVYKHWNEQNSVDGHVRDLYKQAEKKKATQEVIGNMERDFHQIWYDEIFWPCSN